MLLGRLALLGLLHSAGAVLVSERMRSFGTVIKAGQATGGAEQEVFEHRTAGGQGTVVQQWWAGNGCADRADTRVRVYADGTLVVNITLGALHGVGTAQETPTPPWGSQFMGHTARAGLFTTLPIPFGEHLRITLELRETEPFWYMVRGVENYPVVLGSLELPLSARLEV
jgi:hypothetical protein